MLGSSPSGSYSATSCSAEDQMDPWNPAVGHATTVGCPTTSSSTRFSTDFLGGSIVGGSELTLSQRLSHDGLASTGSDFTGSGSYFSNNLHTSSAAFPSYENHFTQHTGNPAYSSMDHANPEIYYRPESQRLSHSNVAAGPFGSHYYSTTAAAYGTPEPVPSSSHDSANQPPTMTRHSTTTMSSLPPDRNAIPVIPSTQWSGNSMVNVTGAGYYSVPSSYNRAYSQPESNSKRSLPESHRRYR